MSKQTVTHARPLLRRLLLSAVLLAVMGYVLAAHWTVVRQSVTAARSAQSGWLLLALLLMGLTFMIAAELYGLLALHRLRWRQTLLVELAAAFVNRLLPAGLGGLGLHGDYLYRRRHSPAEATVVVSVNNLLGMVAHLALLGAVIVWRPETLQLLAGRVHLPTGLLLGLLAAVLLAGLLSPLRSRLRRFLGNIMASVRRVRPASLVRAWVGALLLTATYTVILLAVARSLGLTLGLPELFVTFSIGMLFGTAAPTPGGLVGTEAGLYAGLVAYGTQPVPAGAVVLLYRLISYWLPLLPGILALLLARRRTLV